METIDLATLIVGAVIGVGVIELVMWLVVIIRHPGFDDLRPDLVPAASTQPSVASSYRGTRSSEGGIRTTRESTS